MARWGIGWAEVYGIDRRQTYGTGETTRRAAGDGRGTICQDMASGHAPGPARLPLYLV
ncbi:hypothetical protein KL86CLO1_13309 [uncultured Eubacteriales bacterium]|uniref:Uncharacterized protein n=1 Tax=uncultured Eubacteriales bacterium TaxID=172733 RepID=A0A212KIK8_9FIRM|nr:hypothetical protein KL86CLO1_13309 [uncultured Eubacteriales bacterium]